MSHSDYDENVPVPADKFSDIFYHVRRILTLFKQRFELNHNMSGVNNTELATADGYHDHITFGSYPITDSYGDIIESPEPVTGEQTFFTSKIDGLNELCLQNDYGSWQITLSSSKINFYESFLDQLVSLGFVLSRIASDGNIFIIGAYKREGSVRIGKIFYSEDLQIWTEKLSISSTSLAHIFDVIYANSIFVAVGETGYYTSPDGITWTQRLVGTSSGNNGFKLAYGEGIFVGVSVGKGVYTSPDGITWTQRLTPYSDYFFSVAYGNGFFIAAGSKYIYKSEDGITWNNVATITDYIYDIGTDGTIFFFGTASGKNIYTSNDGINWTFRKLCSSGIYSSYYSSITKKYICCGVGEIYLSDDSIIWTLIESNIVEEIHGISEFSNRTLSWITENYIIFSSIGKIYVSPEFKKIG